MRTYLLDDAAALRTKARPAAAPHPWERVAWATDSPLAQWSEREHDSIGTSVSLPAPHGEPNPPRTPAADDTPPITLLTLGCLAHAALVSGSLLFSVMRFLIG
jgi:hypothetical protein